MLHASEARADASSWLSAGGGYSLQRADSKSTYDRATVMTFSLGVGTDPNHAIVAGGLLRSTTYLTLGTDVSLALRIATGGFARGQWGFAFDVGPKWRTWSSGDYGRFPLTGMAVLGAPFGLQVGVGVDAWNIAGAPYARGGFALLEIDLLRLTVMRRGATNDYWANPSPAGGR